MTGFAAHRGAIRFALIVLASSWLPSNAAADMPPGPTQLRYYTGGEGLTGVICCLLVGVGLVVGALGYRRYKKKRGRLES